MRIAQVAPLHEPIPPAQYGGTERIVHYLTEELVRHGHDVTLYASADSKTSARLVAGSNEALRLSRGLRDPTAAHMAMIEQVCRDAQHYDLIHFHTDYLHFFAAHRLGVPDVTTLHGRLDIMDLDTLFRFYRDRPVISISNDQRGPLPHANWQATVYNGIPTDLYARGNGSGGYLAFLGRMSPEKRPDRAIEIALRAGLPIKLAAKVDRVDQEYFTNHIRPLLCHSQVEYVGEISDGEKGHFLGRAVALLLPIEWPEPFGLVLIEAMACGTPVIAWRRGAIPEVVDHGLTGYIVDSMEDAVTAVRRVEELNRDAIRSRFETRFSGARMASAYLDVYERLRNQHQSLEIVGQRDTTRHAG